EVHAADFRRVDGEARVLERTQDLLPGLLRGRGVLLHQDELRAGRQPLAQAQARPYPQPLRLGRHGAEQRLRPGGRRERCGTQRETWLLPERRAQLEAGDEETSDHGNVCSTRTHVRRQGGTDITSWWPQGIAVAAAKTVIPMRTGAFLALPPLLVAAAFTPQAAASDPSVAALQVGLHSRGLYRGPIDGITGPATQKAIRKLQTRARIAVVGVVGPK